MKTRRIVLDLTKFEAENLDTLVRLGESYLQDRDQIRAYFGKPGQLYAQRRAKQKLRRAILGII